MASTATTWLVGGEVGFTTLPRSTMTYPMSGVQFPSPGGNVNYIYGISGNTLVGNYIQASRFHPTLGFVYIIPEPPSIALALIGIALLILARRVYKRGSLWSR